LFGTLFRPEIAKNQIFPCNSYSFGQIYLAKNDFLREEVVFCIVVVFSTFTYISWSQPLSKCPFDWHWSIASVCKVWRLDFSVAQNM